MVLGLKVSFRHFKDAIVKKKRVSVGASSDNYFDQQNGIFTNTYPHEALPVPDNGRYRLDNEIEDCIVCDKCAKVCPVDCIDIEAVKSPQEIRKTSDGSSVRLHAAKFDIDMAKCCYCGLCTTVCPTECLTMTKTFDFSEFDIRNMVYEFSDMSDKDVAEKKKEYEDHQANKKRANASVQGKVDVVAKPKVVIPGKKAAPGSTAPKPKKPDAGALKPKIGGAALKPKIAKKETGEGEAGKVLKPKIPVVKEAKKALKPIIKKTTTTTEGKPGETKKSQALKPIIKKPNISKGSDKPKKSSALKPVIKKKPPKDDVDG